MYNPIRKSKCPHCGTDIQVKIWSETDGGYQEVADIEDTNLVCNDEGYFCPECKKELTIYSDTVWYLGSNEEDDILPQPIVDVSDTKVASAGAGIQVIRNPDGSITLNLSEDTARQLMAVTDEQWDIYADTSRDDLDDGETSDEDLDALVQEYWDTGETLKALRNTLREVLPDMEEIHGAEEEVQ